MGKGGVINGSAFLIIFTAMGPPTRNDGMRLLAASQDAKTETTSNASEDCKRFFMSVKASIASSTARTKRGNDSLGEGFQSRPPSRSPATSMSHLRFASLEDNLR